MVNKVDLIRDELRTATRLPDVYYLEEVVDGLIDDFGDDVEMAVIGAEAALLAVEALSRRIFVENPRGLDTTIEPSQSRVEAEQ